MAAVVCCTRVCGAALARRGPGAGRALAQFLRVLSVPEATRSLATETAAHRVAGSTLQEQSVPLESEKKRIYLVSQHEPTFHALQDALRALRAYSLAEFEETVEVSLCCNLLTKKGKKRDPFRGNIIFPHQFGKDPKLLVFAEVCLSFIVCVCVCVCVCAHTSERVCVHAGERCRYLYV